MTGFQINNNDLGKRLALLYRASDNYLNNKKILRPEVVTTEIIRSENGQNINITIGKEINIEDELDITIQINSILHQIGKLKDHTINSLIRNGFAERHSKNMVNEYINNNLPLALITDLHNQEKHKYPATKFIRTHLHPKIANIRYVLEPNLHFGWTNIFTEGQMVFEADIIDKDANHILSFRELITVSIELWEKFYLLNVDEVSDRVKKRVDKKEKWNKKYQEFLKRESYSMKETTLLSNWQAIKSEDLKPGMLLKVFNKESRKEIFGGIAIESLQKNDICIHNVFDNGAVYRFITDEFYWMIFASVDIDKNEKVYKYYYELLRMREEAKENQPY